MAEEETDDYLTISSPGEFIYTEKRSKFLAFAYPVSSTEEIKMILADLQKKYYDARHLCYAYMLGAKREDWRANDNGEPSGTAGKPILGQINSNELTDILVVVVRYFGGVKLGTSGLIDAYREAASGAIGTATKITKYIEKSVNVLFNYDMMNVVMRIIKELNVPIASQDFGTFESMDEDYKIFECKMIINTRLSDIQKVISKLDNIITIQGNAKLRFYTEE